MPTVLTCSIIMQSDAGHGWSESHKLSVDTVPGSLTPQLSALRALAVNYRRPLLAADCFLKGLRVSYPLGTTPKSGVASSGDFFSPPMYPTNTFSGAAPTLSANMRLGEVTNSKFSTVYLRGFWDAVETDEELDFVDEPGKSWLELLNRYKDSLVTAKYGWMAQDATLVRRGKVTGYISDINGMIVFTVAKDSGPLMPAVGTISTIRCAQLNNSHSPLNKTMRVVSVSPTELRTVIPTAAGPFQSAGIFTMNGKSFVQYTGMQYCRLGKHNPGRPIGEAPGRRKARAVS